MPGPTIAGTFATGAAASVGNASDVCNIHSSATQLRLTVAGLDASNTVKTQKRTSPGGAWVDQTTYNADQSAAPIVVAPGEEWCLVQVSQQAIRDIRYKLSLEN